MHREHFLKATAAPPITAMSGACSVPIKGRYYPASVPTGIPALNDVIQSFRNQELTVIAFPVKG
jgi:hypothetical protein